MPEIANALELADAVRAIQRRRQFDDAGVRLSLELAQRGTVWVARDQGETIGIVVAHDSEEERYVGDLFVEPSYRGQGFGAGLLEAALSDAGDLAQTMLFDPSDAAAFALALRQRMAQRESLVRFAGAIPREEELAKMAAGEYRFQVDVVDPLAHSFALNGLDRQSRGAVRPSDHTEFARSATGHCFFLSGELVGYAYVWPDGRLGPLACASEAYLVQIFAYALVTLQRGYGASWCSALIPGSNRRIARAALRAGLRIQKSSLLASDALDISLSTYIGYHELLF
ncbi:MAG: GNAT family N-acetyltransferase [Candidatus Cybelea sp.]